MLLSAYLPPLKARPVAQTASALTQLCLSLSVAALAWAHYISTHRGGHSEGKATLKSHADITRTLLSTHIREECVKEVSHLPGCALITKKDAGVLTSRLGTELQLLIGQRSLEVFVRNVARCWTRTGLLGEFTERQKKKEKEEEETLWILKCLDLFITTWVYFTCQSWGNRLEHNRPQREALQFSPQ